MSGKLYKLYDTNKHQNMFKHLVYANQSYFEHFHDSITYSWMSCKAAFAFFGHALWPDAFETTGSSIIFELQHKIIRKYEERNLENKETYCLQIV